MFAAVRALPWGNTNPYRMVAAPIVAWFIGQMFLGKWDFSRPSRCEQIVNTGMPQRDTGHLKTTRIRL
jgi:hypothetical protein